MQRLNLAKNKLTQIPHSALSGLAYLETLELSDNPINQINEGDFNGNFLIPQVNLVLFSILSGKVSETLTLLTFYFQCLLFKRAHSPIFVGTLIKILMSYNSNFFQGLDSLDHLIMNHNALDHLGKGFFSGLPKLTTLYLDHNQIKQIHQEAFIGLECKYF